MLLFVENVTKVYSDPPLPHLLPKEAKTGNPGDNVLCPPLEFLPSFSQPTSNLTNVHSSHNLAALLNILCSFCTVRRSTSASLQG